MTQPDKTLVSPKLPKSKPPSLGTQLLLAAVIIIATFIVYRPALNAGFIWDDDYYVARNFALRSFSGLIDIWFVPWTEPQYYPFTHTTFWLEYHLWEVQRCWMILMAEVWFIIAGGRDAWDRN